MKLITFRHQGKEQCGVISGEDIYPLDRVGIPDILSLIANWPLAKADIEQLKAQGGQIFSLSEVDLLAPLLNPPRIFGIGLNYLEHAAESKMKVQDVPTVFLKLQSSIIGYGAPIPLPPNALEPDYEAELAVVIGKPGHHIAETDWKQHVFGYTILNDVSARGVQFATTQWTLGKSFPGFTPMGPSIVTADEISDPHSLDISLTIDGETLQSANTRDLIFRIPALIAYLSSIVPLQTGDIISTGTPPGVGLGRTPKRWLKPGETIEIQISSVGTLRNSTIAVER